MLTSASFRSSRKRNAEFKEALQTQVELMPALSETKQGMKKIMQMTRENFKEIWMPLVEAIIKKTLHMFEVCESQERRVVLIDELATCADWARSRAVMTELNELAMKDRMVAFRSHAE